MWSVYTTRTEKHPKINPEFRKTNGAEEFEGHLLGSKHIIREQIVTSDRIFTQIWMLEFRSQSGLIVSSALTYEETWGNNLSTVQPWAFFNHHVGRIKCRLTGPGITHKSAIIRKVRNRQNCAQEVSGKVSAIYKLYHVNAMKLSVSTYIIIIKKEEATYVKKYYNVKHKLLF